VREYVYKNGRRYGSSSYSETYKLPNDEQEQDRLDMLHHIFMLILDGASFIAPIGPTPQRILDIGTGTGIWAMDVADAYPSAEVIGIDLSPIQPVWVPPNCQFIIDDVETDWPYPPSQAFDLVHTRTMMGAIKDWPRLYKQSFDHLKPGGWIEVQESDAWITSDDDSKDRAPAVRKWVEEIDRGSVAIGARLNVASTHKESIEKTGFKNVHQKYTKVINAFCG
jgi:trans-aconitate methyltransferase